MNQNSFEKPESYTPILEIPEEERKQSLKEMAFDVSDSDFTRPPSGKIIENRLTESQSILVTSGRSGVNTKIANNSKKKTDELLFEFTAWMRFQIITYHLVEPVLIACLMGACLNMPQLETLCVIIVCMGLYFPFLLSASSTRIKIKMIASMISMAFVFLMLIFKLVVYYKEYPNFVADQNMANFLGIYYGNPDYTFIIDAVLISLLGLLFWNQSSQFKQCNLGNQMGDKKLSKQIEVKYRHPVFGEGLHIFYVISYLVFIVDTFFYQSFVQLAILTAQLCQCYMWSVKVEISITAKKQVLRTMQMVSFLTLSVAFIFSMPYIFDGFDKNNARLIELMGYVRHISPTQIFWRVHIVLLASAIILSEVFFVAENIHARAPMRVQAKVEDQNQKIKRGLERLTSPVTLWIARAGCFIWLYLYHDYQSLILLIWIIHSTLYVRTPLFVKATAYFYLPIFNALVLWYFTTNVYGLIEWQNFTEEETIVRYRYGFFSMTMASLEFGFMFFNVFIISYYCRQNFEKNVNPIQSDSILKEMGQKDSTLLQIFYLTVLYLEYPLFLAMVMSALAKMDFYHIFLLFIFVAYTLFPKFFLKNTVFLLIYAEFFVFIKYVWTLVTNTSPGTGWLYIIGISTSYNPQTTRQYFRYVPHFDQWIIVLLTFLLYRRSLFVGTDYNKIKEKELECIKDLYYKSPTTKKIFTTIDILISHCIIIFTFLLFILILVFMRRSFLNLVSLVLVLINICTYLSSGIQKLNYFWNIFTFYQAFVLLSILFYQFVFQSGLSEQQWFIKQQSTIGLRTQAYIYWAGYYKFDKPIFYHFFAYVILFSFAVLIRGRFRQKQEMDDLRVSIVVPEQVIADGLLFQNDEANRLFEFQDQQAEREQSLRNSMVSARSSAKMTRKEAEAQLTDYQIKIQENYINMLYQIQYPIWKSRSVWPVFTFISRYFNFILSVLIFCFAIYFQIGLIWLIFLIIYLMQAWFTSNMHIRYKIEQYNNFQPSLPPTIIDNSEPSEKKITITEQEVFSEYEKFQQNVHKTSLQSRHQFWLIQFVLLIVSIFFVYLSDFVTTTYTDSETGAVTNFIPDVNLQNMTLFLFFWSGFLRNESSQESSLDYDQALIRVYWPFFLVIFFLIIEKLSQFWLTDKFGTNEELIKQWEQIEKLYNENCMPKDVKSSVLTKSNNSNKKTYTEIVNVAHISDSSLNDSRDNSPTSRLEKHPSSTANLGQTGEISESIPSLTPNLLQNTETQEENNLRRPLSSIIEEEFFNVDFESAGDQSREMINSFYKKSNQKEEQIREILKPMLTAKSKVTLHRALKIFFEEFIILLLWFSCIQKQSIFSLGIFIVIVYHTFVQSQRNSDKPMLLVRYTIVFILVCEYSIYLANLTSYSSPTPFPVQLTPPEIIDNKAQTTPYPSWNSTTNDYEFYYFYIPFYFATPLATRTTPPSINVNLFTYFSIFVDSDQQDGMWCDFIITLLVVFYLDSCNFFIITKRIKVVSSQQCKTQIQEYAKMAGYSDKTTKEVKKELSVMISLNRFVEYCSKLLYQDFFIVMIAWVIIISIYSRTLISFGYFLFCTILIFQSRNFFLTKDSHLTQQKLLRQGLLPYLLLDILLTLIYQLPVKQFDDYSHKWPEIVGFQTYWISKPPTLTVGYVGQVSTTLQNPLTPLYLKGIAYLSIMIQLAIIESHGFMKYKQKLFDENKVCQKIIGQGIAYRFNNFKSQQILENAKSLSDLKKMLLDVKKLIKRRDMIFKAQQTLMRTGKLSPKVTVSEIDEDEQVQEKQKKDYKKEFYTEVQRDTELRMKNLNCCQRMYLRLRLYYVQDILFKKSQEHLKEIVKEFEGGRTGEKTNLERGITIQVKLDLLQKIEQDIVEQNGLRVEKLRDLKETVDAETFKVAQKKEQAEAEKQVKDYVKFKNKQLASIHLKPWQRIDIETFQSWQTLAFSYLNLGYKIIVSNTEWICYIFMLTTTYNDGGLLYQVYPLIIFGYALLEESKPGRTFWFFTIIYTNIIILAQFTVQLKLWQYFYKEQVSKFLNWTQTWNLGLVYSQDQTISGYSSTFIPEILIVMSVMLHIQSETITGVFDKKHYDFETFEEGLQRYQLTINKNDAETYERLQKMFQVQSVIRNDLEFDEILQSRPRRAQSLDIKEFTELQRQQIQINHMILSYKGRMSRTPILRSDGQIFEAIDVEQGSKSMIGSEGNEKQLTMANQLHHKIWNSGFFQRLFPQTRQQKPGKDYYTWTTLISFTICIYIILFFTQMSGQKTTLADQYSSNMFQAGMVITLFVMIAIMVIDRIFYGSHAAIKIDAEKETEIASVETQKVNSSTSQDNQSQKRTTSVNRTESKDLGSRKTTTQKSQDQLEVQKTSFDQQSSQDLSVIYEDEHDNAFDQALILTYRKNSWKTKIKVFYFWTVLVLVQWFVFFNLPNQQKYCSHAEPYCNRFSNNPALICFYTLFVIYFILQAFQLQTGMPEIRKGGFMVGQYDTISKTIFYIWYYIPFLFELRSIIDWTFSDTALDIFQWLKLASVQADLYIAKCTMRPYRAKPLGSKIAIAEKVALGCGLMVLILGLIAGPMLLFSSINPVSQTNAVSSGTLALTLQIYNLTQQTSYNVELFGTTQVTSLQYLTQSEFNNLQFNQYFSTTGIFPVSQVQAVEFAQSSDNVWTVSTPTRQVLQESLQLVQDEDPSISITALLTARFLRPSGQANFTTQLSLTNQSQPQIIQTLIDQIQCIGTSPIVNAFPLNMTTITVSCGPEATPLQPGTYQAGFDLIYNCNNTNPSTNYWSLNQTYPLNTTSSILQEYTQLFPQDGFGFFTFSQNTLPRFLASYGASIFVFYATIVYVVASSLRSGLVPTSYEIFITDAPLTEDILMICTSIQIYRMQRDLSQEEELYFILIDIMRSPEMIKELSKSSLKPPPQAITQS